MKPIAIAFASRNGQTEKIARYLAWKLEERGYPCHLINTDQDSNPSLEEFSGVICGTPVHRGKFPPSLERWALAHSSSINRLPSAFFTVSLNAADARPAAREADRELLARFARRTWCFPKLTASFAGALKFREYWWPLRLLMRNISRKAGGGTDTRRNYEYTDWTKVDAFLTDFAAKLERERAYEENLKIHQATL